MLGRIFAFNLALGVAVPVAGALLIAGLVGGWTVIAVGLWG